MKGKEFKGSCLSGEKIEARDWFAWLNLMPPGPCSFHVKGDILVANVGIEPLLTLKVPQGINPGIVLMDLILIQKPGYWPMVQVWKQVSYEKIAKKISPQYAQVQIFYGDSIIADIPVEVIQ